MSWRIKIPCTGRDRILIFWRVMLEKKCVKKSNLLHWLTESPQDCLGIQLWRDELWACALPLTICLSPYTSWGGLQHSRWQPKNRLKSLKFTVESMHACRFLYLAPTWKLCTSRIWIPFPRLLRPLLNIISFPVFEVILISISFLAWFDQVRIRVRKQCKPLEEDSFRPILHHYDGPKFRLQLSIPEVDSTFLHAS